MSRSLPREAARPHRWSLDGLAFGVGVWSFRLFAGTCLAVLPWLWWQGGRVDLRLPPSHIAHVSGAAYRMFALPIDSHVFTRRDEAGTAPESFFFRVASETEAQRRLRIYEDGTPLEPVDAEIEDLRLLGAGRYSHRASELIFSSSDGSDPRANGRAYTLRGAIRPRLDAVPLIVGGTTWLAAVALLVFGVSRLLSLGAREEMARLAPGAVGSMLLVAMFSCWTFFLAELTSDPGRQILVFLGLVAGAGMAASRRVLALRRWMLLPVGFLAYGALGAVLSISPLASWNEVESLLRSSLLGLVVVLAMRGSWPAGRRDAPALFLSSLCLVLAAAVLLQNLGFDLEGLGGYSWIPWSGWNRKYVESWLILLFWGSLAAFEPLSQRRRWVAGGLYAVTALAILTGYSQTAKVVCLVAPIVFLATLRLSRVAVRFLAWGFVGLFLLAPVLAGAWWSLATRQGGLADSGRDVSVRATHRLVIWEYSRRQIAERPILGWGLGASTALAALQKTAHEALDEDLPESWGELRVIDGGHPHSLPLLIWLETGAIGVSFCVALLWVGLRRLGRVDDPWSRAALLTLMTSILLFFCLNYPAWHPTMITLWVTTIGLAAALVSSSTASVGHDGIAG